jgi:hypothetical protein|tara:strand:+ start:4494 stop:4715 length:222 start_codon:yes stop_codon:yes gene_type:complete
MSIGTTFTEADVSFFKDWVAHSLNPDEKITVKGNTDYTPNQILDEVRKGTNPDYNPSQAIVDLVTTYRDTIPP